jgi:hypothetical protein
LPKPEEDLRCVQQTHPNVPLTISSRKIFRKYLSLKQERERGRMITQKYILMCDEVRQEINGKLFIIGLYTPDMAVPQIPYAIPSLTFFMARIYLTDYKGSCV